MYNKELKYDIYAIIFSNGYANDKVIISFKIPSQNLFQYSTKVNEGLIQALYKFLSDADKIRLKDVYTLNLYNLFLTKMKDINANRLIDTTPIIDYY